MYRLIRNSVASIAVGIALTLVGASPSLSAPARAPQAQAGAHSVTRDAAQRICFDEVFYAALPGKTDYCLGLRDWENGNYASGLNLLTLSAGWGNKSAQYTLGLIYFNGHHVAADRALGIAWLRLADQRHNDAEIARVTRSVIKLATPSERARAERLYARMLARYGDKVAAARAWHHWRHWQRGHAGENQGTVCLYGRQLWAVRHAGISGAASGVARAIQAAAASANIKHTAKCIGITLATQQHVLHTTASIYFAGWMGVVTVGPLEHVPASAASTHH